MTRGYVSQLLRTFDSGSPTSATVIQTMLEIGSALKYTRYTSLDQVRAASHAFLPLLGGVKTSLLNYFWQYGTRRHGLLGV